MKTKLKELSTHLHGSTHSTKHKFFTGIFIMFIGVFIAKSSHAIDIMMAQYLLDMAGYFVHGVGAVPFIEHYINNANETN